MNNLMIERENIVEKLRGIEGAAPSLEEQLASLKEKRTQLLTEVALRGDNGQDEDITRLDSGIAAITQEISDNEDVAANLKLKLSDVEKGIRVQETAQDEVEYVQTFEKLGTLTEDVEQAYMEAERIINDLHSLGREYWNHRTKRKILSEKFRSFMDVEKLESISARISIAALVKDDGSCKEMKCRLSEIIRERNPLNLSTTLKSVTPLLVF